MGAVNHQLGIAEEVTYGTAVAASRWLEFLSESLNLETTTLASSGMAPGRRFPSVTRVVQTKAAVSGDIEMEVSTTGMGLLFKHMLGTDTPSIVQQAATIAYLHTYTLGGMTDSLTIQKGVQRVDDPAVVEPFTVVGAMFTGWTMAIDVDGILRLTLNVDGRDMLDADNDSDTLDTASYPSGLKVFHFAQGAVEVNGTPVANVSSAEVSANWNLATDRYHLGSSGRKAQPRNQFGDAITGSFVADFGNPADLYNAYHSNTTVAIDLEFVGDNIASTYDERLTVKLGAVKLGGSTPQVSGGELVTVDVPWTAYQPASGQVITIEYMTTDTTV